MAHGGGEYDFLRDLTAGERAAFGRDLLTADRTAPTPDVLASMAGYDDGNAWGAMVALCAGPSARDKRTAELEEDREPRRRDCRPVASGRRVRGTARWD